MRGVRSPVRSRELWPETERWCTHRTFLSLPSHQLRALETRPPRPVPLPPWCRDSAQWDAETASTSGPHPEPSTPSSSRASPESRGHTECPDHRGDFRVPSRLTAFTDPTEQGWPSPALWCHGAHNAGPPGATVTDPEDAGRTGHDASTAALSCRWERAIPRTQMVENLPAMQETWI